MTRFQSVLIVLMIIVAFISNAGATLTLAVYVNELRDQVEILERDLKIRVDCAN